MTTLITELTPELEAEFRLNIIARNKKLALENAAEAKKETIGDYLPEFIKLARSMSGKCEETDNSSCGDNTTVDTQGRTWVSREDLWASYDAEAMERHGNDPNKRFDEWNFPGTPNERKFLLEHDFGPLLKNSLAALEAGNWVYAHGEVGNGKTALAMRTAWQLLEPRPSAKASFVSMNQYSLDQIQRENAETVAIRRGEPYTEDLNFHETVILDDFDKVNYRNEHKLRTALDLVERLKKGKHRVFITSQLPLFFGREEEAQRVKNEMLPSLYCRYSGMFDIKPLIDRLRQMCLVLPEFKEKSRRRFQ